jgi:DNA-binding beta-propeller fold protein YncE
VKSRNRHRFSAACTSRFAAFSFLCASLFVPVLATNASPPKNRIVASLKISNPRDAVCSADNQYVYVASNNSNFTQSQVVVISVATHEVISQFDAGAQALALAISPDGQTLYSIDDNCDIQVISTANQTVTGTISLNLSIFPDSHQNWHLA